MEQSLASLGKLAAKGNRMNRHAVVFMAYNQVYEQHSLTVEALESVFRQDIGPLDVLMIDNGSTFLPTWEHFQMVRDMHLDGLTATAVHCIRNRENYSPVKMANRALDYWFQRGHDKVLFVPNDVILPVNFYRLLNQWPRGIVTASQIDTKAVPESTADQVQAVSECTPMATAITRKWFYDALVAKDGYFLDEGYFHYASDCDFALRMAACGIRGVQLNLPYYHATSSSWRMLPTHEMQRKITDQADIDRAYFERKWGFKVDSLEYGQLPGNVNFRGIPVSPMVHSATHGSK